MIQFSDLQLFLSVSWRSFCEAWIGDQAPLGEKKLTINLTVRRNSHLVFFFPAVLRGPFPSCHWLVCSIASGGSSMRDLGAQCPPPMCTMHNVAILVFRLKNTHAPPSGAQHSSGLSGAPRDPQGPVASSRWRT